MTNNLAFVELESKTDPTGFTSNTLLVVVRGIVVDRNIPTADGPLGDNPKHVDGEKWCQDLFKGGMWKQTFKDNSFRKQGGGQGFTYDPVKDVFIRPQPFLSFSLNENSEWEAPVTFPTDTTGKKAFIWDEEGQKWTAVSVEDDTQKFNWDASGLTWVSA